ncbi:4'-phosphopantetheinyl transferase family protein [Streptomyces afghaniensis]|uniref:4'-phosphopantetheinyl transferase family protein n=1 Tax=Streptomyces afghaniensis TaxID=66865 RepID=UPI0037997E64
MELQKGALAPARSDPRVPVLVLSCDWRSYEAPEELLGPRERAQAAALPGPARRREWVRGRLTAKAAVRLATGAHSTQILTSVGGAPRAVPTAAAHAAEPTAISLSHTGSVVVCAAMPGSEPLGVDVEPVDPCNDVFLRRVLRPEEEAAVPRGRPGLRSTACISCKEAAVKAFRRPSVRLRDYRLCRGPRGSVWVEVDGTDLPRLRLWRDCSRGLLTAVCAPSTARPAYRRLSPARVLALVGAAVPPGETDCPGPATR